MPKDIRNWNDDGLSGELRISEKALEDVKDRRKQASEEAVGLRMLYELFPQMAV